jgi:hypothetical protein
MLHQIRLHENNLMQLNNSTIKQNEHKTVIMADPLEDYDPAVPTDDEDGSQEAAPVANSAYKSCWNKYSKYVDEECGGPTNNKYLTRANVDAFFTDVLPLLKIQPPQAVRYRTALQWYSKKIEYPQGGDSPEFIVDSEKVQQGINRHATKYLLSYATGNHDAHAGLGTDVLTNEDHLKALQCVFGDNGTAAYKDFACSWTGCMSTFVRQDTI